MEEAELRQLVTLVWDPAAQSLGLDENLFEYGLNSIHILRFVDVLSQHAGLSATLSDFYTQPSLSHWLKTCRQLREQEANHGGVTA